MKSGLSRCFLCFSAQCLVHQLNFFVLAPLLLLIFQNFFIAKLFITILPSTTLTTLCNAPVLKTFSNKKRFDWLTSMHDTKLLASFSFKTRWCRSSSLSFSCCFQRSYSDHNCLSQPGKKKHRDVTMRCAQFLSMEVSLTWGTVKTSSFQGSRQFQQSVLTVFFFSSSNACPSPSNPPYSRCNVHLFNTITKNNTLPEVRNDSSNSQSQPTILRLTSTSVSTSALNLISSLQLVLNLGIQIQLHLPLENFSCVVYENWVASCCTQLIHHNDSSLTTWWHVVEAFGANENCFVSSGVGLVRLVALACTRYQNFRCSFQIRSS